MTSGDNDTTTTPTSFDEDDALEHPFFTTVEDDEPPLLSADPVLARKSTPEVTARRAKLSWAVKAVVLGAAVLCAFAAVARLDGSESPGSQMAGVAAPAR
jgi:hypothetical protein